MHELSICRALLQQSIRLCEQHAAHTITKIIVQVGALSGLEAHLLQQAFLILRLEYPHAAQAELILETVPIKIYCPHCQIESDAALNNLTCPHCGNWETQLRSGEALILKQLEFT
jgi:hydrogenase nickel incorporation protein HypA/HybF